MTRIRLTLLLLLIGIALPTALIVQRAVESLAVENAVQHDAVADRLFDEMERSLSDFLLREEARPPSDFDPGSVSANAPASPGRLRATAFKDAEEPFILGWFAVDAERTIRIHAASEENNDGQSETRITLALREGLGSRSASASNSDSDSDSSADREAFGRAKELEQKEQSLQARKRDREAIVATKLEDTGSSNAQDFSNELTSPKTPAPGRTQSLSKKGNLRDKDIDAELATRDEASTYDLLQSLNRAQELRSERQSKVLSEPPAPTFKKSAPGPRIETDSVADAASQLQGLGYALPSQSPQSLSFQEDAARPEEGLAETLPREIAVDPLTGRATSSGDLLLVRSVWESDAVERQGLVLDRDALALWLERSVLGESALAGRAELVFGPQSGQPSQAAHAYLHRFGEPFETMVARLDLQMLPNAGSARPIYMIVGLLALVTVVGLFAVERMTRVVVDYAQRRSDFVAAVSHELKTPLTSIRMYSEMLRDGLVSSTEKRTEYYATITDESERLSRLIDNVLEFSRLEQNRREPALVVGGIAEAIQAAADKLRAHVEREGFSLEVELAADIPPVQYDKDAVTQLLFNLVDNALKYARNAKKRSIRIELARKAQGDIELAVRDFGPGVPETEMRRIFEPFYRAGEELTRDTAGTGIGLALVKELAEDMGATALGRNAAGGGFEVCISFSPASA